MFIIARTLVVCSIRFPAAERNSNKIITEWIAGVGFKLVYLPLLRGESNLVLIGWRQFLGAFWPDCYRGSPVVFRLRWNWVLTNSTLGHHHGGLTWKSVSITPPGSVLTLFVTLSGLPEMSLARCSKSGQMRICILVLYGVFLWW